MRRDNSQAKKIDAILASWSRWVKRGDSLRFMKYATVQVFVASQSLNRIDIDDDVLREVDYAVGRLPHHFQKVIIRKYLDPRPEGSPIRGYYPEHRTHTEMAKTEKITVSMFDNYLQLARHQLIGALQEILL